MLTTEAAQAYDLFLVALCVWREARGEGEQGMLGVACTIRNRMKRWNASAWMIVTARNQFSAMSVVGDGQTIKWPSPLDHTWGEALVVTRSVLGIGVEPCEDVTHGALYYWNPRASSPAGWFARNIAGRPDLHARTAVIGGHEFYA